MGRIESRKEAMTARDKKSGISPIQENGRKCQTLTVRTDMQFK